MWLHGISVLFRDISVWTGLTEARDTVHIHFSLPWSRWQPSSPSPREHVTVVSKQFRCKRRKPWSMLCAGWLHLGYRGHWCRWHGQRCSRVATHQGECLRCRKKKKRKKKRWWMEMKTSCWLIITYASYIAHSIFSFSHPGAFLFPPFFKRLQLLYLARRGCLQISLWIWQTVWLLSTDGLLCMDIISLIRKRPL